MIGKHQRSSSLMFSISCSGFGITLPELSSVLSELWQTLPQQVQLPSEAQVFDIEFLWLHLYRKNNCVCVCVFKVNSVLSSVHSFS